MISHFLGLFTSFFNTNKVMIYIIIVSILISFFFYIKISSYEKGYNTGVEVTEGKYAQEKIKWFAKVTNLQNEYENTVNGILTSYNGHISELESQIDKLESQDPIIKTRYIHKYVPIEVNCTIPKGFVELHNISAKGLPLSEDVVDPMNPTNRTLQDVGQTVAINYYEYNKLANQIRALQKIVIEFQNKQKELLE